MSDFQYGLRSSQSTTDLLIVVSDRIAGAFNKSGATQAIAIDIYLISHNLRLSTGFGMLVFFINLSFMEFLVGYLEVVLYGKSSQEYSVTASAAQGFILAPTLFLLKINELPHDVICNIAIYADDNTLYSNSKCDQISDLWQLESTSELESDQ